MKKDKKEEEDRDGGNPYNNLEKTSVLQEARYNNRLSHFYSSDKKCSDMGMEV